jgi:hypothetical protein
VTESEAPVSSSREVDEDQFTVSFKSAISSVNASSVPLVEEDLKKKNIEELRSLLRSLNLSVKGNKAELIQRALSEKI